MARTRAGSSIPCDHVIRPGGLGTGNSHIIFSDDAGAQPGTSAANPPKNEFNESQVVELSDGKLMLNMGELRPGGESRAAPKERGVCISDDGGVTFRDLRRDAALTEPLCQASVLRFDDKRILFANPASTKREKMTVRISADDGATWKSSQEIFAGPSAYSCLVAMPPGDIRSACSTSAARRTPTSVSSSRVFALQQE